MKRAAIVGIAAAAAAALTVGAFWLMSSRPPDLRAAVDDYLSALSDGDYAAVAELRADGSDSAIDATLETAFAGASEYISNVQDVTVTSDTEMPGGSATVELSGARHTIFFGFSLIEGRWRLTNDFLGTLTVTTSLGDSVHVGGALVPVSVKTALLPASYPITAAPTGVLDGQIDVAVTNEEPTSATLSVTLAAGVVAQAQTQLDAYADTCADASTAVPDNCGIRVPWAADLLTLDHIAFRVEQYPVASISEDATAFAATDGIIVATATGTSRAGGTASFTYRADDWALRGTVAFAGDEMVLAVG